MDYLETAYLEKAAIARRLKADILDASVSRRQRATGGAAPFSLVHHIDMHLLPVGAPRAGSPMSSRIDVGLDESCEDAA